MSLPVNVDAFSVMRALAGTGIPCEPPVPNAAFLSRENDRSTKPMPAAAHAR